jgi:hypothetical protein
MGPYVISTMSYIRALARPFIPHLIPTMPSHSSTPLFLSSLSPSSTVASLPSYRLLSDYEPGAGFTPEPMEGGVLLGRVHLSSPIQSQRSWIHTESMSETVVSLSPVPSPPIISNPGTPLSLAFQPLEGTQITWPPSRVSSRVSSVPSRAASGAVRRGRGGIVPGDDDLPPMSQLNTVGNGFRFAAKTYFCTWSQVGDTPNEALEVKMAGFGNLIKGISH